MIGLDTNILVRYLAQDDARQTEQAIRLIESLTPAQPGYLSLLVVTETVWVLESCYDTGRSKIAQIVETLLSIDSLVVEQSDTAWRALRRFKREGGDFSDALIAAQAVSSGCDTVYTFDKGAAKRTGMTLLK